MAERMGVVIAGRFPAIIVAGLKVCRKPKDGVSAGRNQVAELAGKVGALLRIPC